jgi:threonine synthase
LRMGRSHTSLPSMSAPSPQSATSWRNPRWSRLSCTSCGLEHDRDVLQTVCRACGLTLACSLDLDPSTLAPAALVGREPSLWRYAEVLPVARSFAVTLGEGFTPLLQVDASVWIKDESRNPTGSFKARGMTAAVSAAKALGARGLVAPSAGNAAGALSAYGAKAGLPVLVALPEDTPRLFVDECRQYGAEVKLVAGTIADAGRWLKEHGPPAGEVFDVSTLKEPHRAEGKKTMAYELYEQFAALASSDGTDAKGRGSLPDVILYPTGGGTGLVGMAKAFDEMQRLGWIGDERPRLVSVQVAGCAPVVKAFGEGAERTEPWSNPQTKIWGLRVPSPIGGYLCLRALKQTKGTGIAIDEAEADAQMLALARRSGIDVCPEGGAAWAAYERLRATGWIAAGERVVVFNTGTGLKYR